MKTARCHICGLRRVIVTVTPDGTRYCRTCEGTYQRRWADNARLHEEWAEQIAAINGMCQEENDRWLEANS